MCYKYEDRNFNNGNTAVKTLSNKTKDCRTYRISAPYLPYLSAKRLVLPTSRACEVTRRTYPCISLRSKICVVRIFSKPEQRNWIKLNVPEIVHYDNVI